MIINQRWILGFFLSPLEIARYVPKNYKSCYNSRSNSSFGSLIDLPIRSSLEFVFDCGYTESLFVTTLEVPLCKKYIIQTIRDYILSNIIILSKPILRFHYISSLNLNSVIFFVCICVTFYFTFSHEIF